MISLQNKNPIAVLKETRKLKGYINQKLLTIFFVCLLGIILIIGFRDNFLTQYEVEVTKAILYPDDGDELSDGNLSLTKVGSLLFQASGWIEPDPFPIRVTSLYSGVVKEVHVLEGQQIKKGEVIATLIDEDARLVIAEMNAKHSQSIAEEAIIEADLELANAGLEIALVTLLEKDQDGE